ncbi:5-formyltetrahydrofolate cyclo-ligase [Sulfurospirillum arcachonense]|uniref:5-formyltetrahydrofolate cyclo-ligase n=1 Tax=Sulfurospirillum arcachonense TaxID=57666 RepID=UPI0004B7413C|nr:5-formyltetrahydrofolate cyclo-ligase [Sulfurospirillum arcachonense]
MNTIKMTRKELFREEAKKKLIKYVKKSKIKRNKYVLEKLKYLISKNKCKNILLYVPLENEADTMQLIRKIRAKVNIYVPFMEGVSFKMVKFRLPLFKKNFNIKEPKNSFMKVPKIDMAIVPVLGVDGTFKRIGFGKGMYDRFFESLQYSPTIVFVQLVECLSAEKLSENHDIRADIYITPYKTIIKRGQYDRYKCSSSCRN